MAREITFADLVHPHLVFDQSTYAHRTAVALIDTPWVQRLRDVSQTANTKLVFMFSEHSRFGHSLGVAYLADVVVSALAAASGDDVERYRAAVVAAAVLHDVGHLAPGSHTAFRSWYPDLPDTHERIGIRVIREDPRIGEILGGHGPGLADDVCRVLLESPELPPWTWQIVSGGGWNVDRGNWCTVDSILAGVNYGRYNIPAITGSLTLTDDGRLALRENRLDAMMHFAVSRHAMYRQIYQHRVLLSADTLNRSVVLRARALGPDALSFCDDVMAAVLRSRSPDDLPLGVIFGMRESWWRYHLGRWRDDPDPILADLSSRLLDRRLFKTARVTDDDPGLAERAGAALARLGLDPAYYLHRISTSDVHKGDRARAMLVRREDGTTGPLAASDPLFDAMAATPTRAWLAMPAEAKVLLGPG